MRSHTLTVLLAMLCVAGSPAVASEVIIQNGNDFEVLLIPNIPLVISFDVTVPEWTQRPTDTFLVVEAGASFLGDLQVLKVTTQALSSGLRAMNPDTRFGLGTFVDKPVGPFGTVSDYEYRTELAVTSDVTTWQTLIDNITFGSGMDEPESQLSSLQPVGLRSEGEVGFRADSLRVAILATDSTYHEAGDHGSAPANNGDTTLDGNPPGSGEDYPSVMQVSQALGDARIEPVFLSGGGVETSFDTLVTQLGTGASLVLEADASSLITAIGTALGAVESDVAIALQTGDADLIDRIVPDSQGNLSAGQMRSFETTLLWDGNPISDNSLSFDLTFDTGTVSITLPEPGSGAIGLAALWTLAGLRRARRATRSYRRRSAECVVRESVASNRAG